MTGIILKKLYKSYSSRKYIKTDFYRDDYYTNYITADDKKLIKYGVYNNYDEMSFKTVKKILKNIDTSENDIFYDLGSGLGKLVVQVLLSTDCKKLVGVEYFEELHNIALEVKKNICPSKPRLCFINKNIVDVDINEATIIYFGISNHEKASMPDDDILTKIVVDKITKSKNLRIVISLCRLDIKYNKMVEKICIPEYKRCVIPGYPYPHFFYFLK